MTGFGIELAAPPCEVPRPGKETPVPRLRPGRLPAWVYFFHVPTFVRDTLVTVDARPLTGQQETRMDIGGPLDLRAE